MIVSSYQVSGYICPVSITYLNLYQKYPSWDLIRHHQSFVIDQPSDFFNVSKSRHLHSFSSQQAYVYRNIHGCIPSMHTRMFLYFIFTRLIGKAGVRSHMPLITVWPLTFLLTSYSCSQAIGQSNHLRISNLCMSVTSSFLKANTIYRIRLTVTPEN